MDGVAALSDAELLARAVAALQDVRSPTASRVAGSLATITVIDDAARGNGPGSWRCSPAEWS